MVGWLIQQQEIGLGDQGLREQHAALHSRRKRIEHQRRIEAHPRQHFVDPPLDLPGELGIELKAVELGVPVRSNLVRSGRGGVRSLRRLQHVGHQQALLSETERHLFEHGVVGACRDFLRQLGDAKLAGTARSCRRRAGSLPATA